MHLRLDLHSRVPIYVQIFEQVKTLVAAGSGKTDSVSIEEKDHPPFPLSGEGGDNCSRALPAPCFGRFSLGRPCGEGPCAEFWVWWLPRR